MVTVSNVSKQLLTFQLHNISFTLPAGFIMGLIGENGAGKTTLLRILAGLYTIDKGEICIQTEDKSITTEINRQDIGVVLQDEVFDESLSLIRNANRYGRFYQYYNKELFLHYAERFSLDSKKKYKHLSKGEKLKFAFAFALSHKPRLLLLDEPSANFDTDFRKEFHQILREYISSGENAVILSTHLTTDIEQYADYILFLKNGNQLLYGDIESIRDDYRMVAGEAYKIKLLTDRIIYIEEREYGSKALVRHSHRPYDAALKTWEPSIEELMYHMIKGGKAS